MSLGFGEGLGGISDMHLQVKESGKPLASVTRIRVEGCFA